MNANDHRVNRLARQALIKLGERPDPALVYSVQLMQWGLDANVIRRSEIDVPLMREAVDTLTQTPHREVMNILDLPDDAPGRPGLQPHHILDKPPRQVAVALLRNLLYKLADNLGQRPLSQSRPARGDQHDQP